MKSAHMHDGSRLFSGLQTRAQYDPPPDLERQVYPTMQSLGALQNPPAPDAP